MRQQTTNTTGLDQGEPRVGLWPLTVYFLTLGTFGFGGPIALAGYMHRDLVERRQWIDEDEYRLGLALAQLSPGPLAAQLAIALGYFRHRILGATLAGVTFVLPAFVMVVGIAVAYVAYGGLWWMRDLFYGVGAAVIAIIALAAYKLSRPTNGRDPLLWGIFAALVSVTVLTQTELAEFFILAGLTVLILRAPPRWLKERVPFLGLLPWPAIFVALPAIPVGAGPTPDLLLQLLLFFVKAGAFVFGSGLAVVPFLYQGVVQQYGWLNEKQFLDAVAVGMITPGPVVVTAGFIGYLVAGLPGTVVAAVAVFLPAYLLTIILAPWFQRHRENAQFKAFVQGATAAATGAIAGAAIILGQRAITDVPTAVIALVSLGLLWRFKLPEPILVVGAGAVGLIIGIFSRGGF